MYSEVADVSRVGLNVLASHDVTDLANRNRNRNITIIPVHVTSPFPAIMGNVLGLLIALVLLNWTSYANEMIFIYLFFFILFFL